MSSTSELPVLILNGTIGAGKSTIGMAIHEILNLAEIPNAFIDLDQLTYCWPPKGRFNNDTMFEALSKLWAVYKSAGATRLVLARVVEKPDALERYKHVLGPSSFAIVRLKAADHIRTSRIVHREFGDSLQWHLKRSVELEKILDGTSHNTFTINNDDKTPDEVAHEILRKISWL
ncbi:MAG: hypothetical protein KTR29_16715 [Rhodothermaceae bacterium]|nr:hypothetical protein [Rhodothermaceae bacterium]